LEREAAKVGLKINEQKIKYMIAARNDSWRGAKRGIGDKHFEVVKEFVYLGSLMTQTIWIYNEESRLQVGASSDCANIYGRATFDARQNLPFTRPCETWMLAKREENQLLVFERKVLRTICGPKIENGVYMRRYNHELDNEFKSPNALNVRSPDNLPHKALFTAKPIGMRNQGSPKSSWANGVNSDSLALASGVRDWAHRHGEMFFNRPYPGIVVPHK
jgi:hypothetical protein